LVLYLLVVNFVGFSLMVVDKWKAKMGKWRIAEKTIWLVSIVGGAVGTAIGMYLFRHKTKHRLFRYGLPLLSLLELLAYLAYT